MGFYHTMLNKCYKIIWQLINFIVGCFETLVWIRLRVIAFMLWLYSLCQTTTSRQQKDIAFLKECKTRLTKIPKHLSLIIGREYHGFTEDILTRILSYAIVMEIDCISLYDTRPLATSTNQRLTPVGLKCSKEINIKCVTDQQQADTGAECVLHYWKNGILKGSKNVCTIVNGHSYQSKCIKVCEIQPAHGRSLLAHICRKFFQERSNVKLKNLLQKRSSFTEYVSEELKQQLCQLTEPELSIVFSNCLCTYGFLPWHTRFTEFHRYESGRRFDAQTFASILYKYARCQQRWGK